MKYARLRKRTVNVIFVLRECVSLAHVEDQARHGTMNDGPQLLLVHNGNWWQRLNLSMQNIVVFEVPARIVLAVARRAPKRGVATFEIGV